MSNLSLGARIVIAFFAVAGVGLIFTINDMPTEPSPPDHTDSVRYKSRALVSASLKAPSTSKFCGEDIRPFNFAGADAWEINGCVDAQNSYGAMLRNNYKIILTKSGSGWNLVSIDFIK